MSDDQAFAIERNGGVVEVVLDRAERRNPLDYRAVLELVGHLDALDADPTVGAILIRGNGTGFCSGGDLSEFQGSMSSSASEFHDGGEGWARLMTMIPAMRVPVVVAAHGYALAGGCGIVAAADIAVAATTTTFGTSEIRIGLFPIVVLPAMQRAIGARRARELALTGRRIDSAEALHAGLVHRVFADDTFLADARALAADVAGLGPNALRMGKELLATIEDVPFVQATAHAKAMRGSFMTTPDFREGVDAFLAKRPAVFRPSDG